MQRGSITATPSDTERCFDVAIYLFANVSKLCPNRRFQYLKLELEIIQLHKNMSENLSLSKRNAVG